MSLLSREVVAQVSEHLGRYVYVLVDPRDGVPFYVGKGQRVRLMDHGRQAEAVDADDADAVAEQSDKTRRINDIRAAGAEPQTWVLRYRLGPEYTAVEAAAIDLLMTFPVTPTAADETRVPLLGSADFTNRRREAAKGAGMRTLDSLVEEFAAPPLEPQEVPLMLITLGAWVEQAEEMPGGGVRAGYGFKREWLDVQRRNEEIEELGDSTRAWWGFGEEPVQRAGIGHLVSVFEGVTRGLFEIVPGSLDFRGPDEKGNYLRGFEVVPVTEGPLYEAVVGPFGHRCPKRKRGDRSTFNYWSAVDRTDGPRLT